MNNIYSQQAATLTHICQSGNLQLLQSYTAKRYALNMDFFASINPKLFEELKAPIKQYNLYLHNQELNRITLCWNKISP